MSELVFLAGIVIGFAIGYSVYRWRVVRQLNAILDAVPSYASRPDYHDGIYAAVSSVFEMKKP